MKKRILILILFGVISNIYANNIKISSDMYFGYDGILVQTFDNESTIQTEVVHTYIVLGDLGPLPTEYYLPNIDEMYTKMLNSIVSYYVDSCSDEYYSWYCYDTKRKTETTLKRPYNRVYIDLIITADSFEKKEFANIDFRYCFDSASNDKEIRRTSLRGVKYNSFQQLLLQFNKGLIFSGCIVTKYELGGTCVFALENIIQPKEIFVDIPEEEAIQIFRVKGVKKTKINLPPEDEKEEPE